MHFDIPGKEALKTTSDAQGRRESTNGRGVCRICTNLIQFSRSLHLDFQDLKPDISYLHIFGFVLTPMKLKDDYCVFQDQNCDVMCTKLLKNV